MLFDSSEPIRTTAGYKLFYLLHVTYVVEHGVSLDQLYKCQGQLD